MEQFVITDGERYVYSAANHKYDFTKNLDLADTYNCATANKILKNCLSKSKSIGFGVAKLENGNVEQIAVPVHNRIKETTQKINEVVSQKKIVEATYNPMEFSPAKEWYSRATAVKNMRQDAQKRKGELMQMQTTIDKCECDLFHYIEFTKLNCRDGYKAYALLHKILRARRIVKDELEIIEYILEQYTPGVQDAADRLCKRIKGKGNRKYLPRELTTLFKNGIGAVDIDNFSLIGCGFEYVEEVNANEKI